ncbi:MAG: hypothetical protein K940chlam3_01241 [Chlamydiae bacterium]|nr:hypothetical protein [Chlamydiota bacterium]
MNINSNNKRAPELSTEELSQRHTKAGRAEPKTIFDLPNELILKIFVDVGFEGLKILPFVSKKFAILSRDDQLLKVMGFYDRHFSKVVAKKIYDIAVNTGRGYWSREMAVFVMEAALEKLLNSRDKKTLMFATRYSDICFSFKKFTDDVEPVSQEYLEKEEWQEMYWKYCQLFRGTCLAQMTSLTSLAIVGSIKRDMGSIKNQIKSLEIDSCQNKNGIEVFENASLISFIASFPNLEELSIKNACESSSIYEQISVVDLSIITSVIDDKGIEALNSMKSLERLSIECKYSPGSVKKLAKLNTLVHLSIRWGESYSSFKELPYLDNLAHLTLSLYYFVESHLEFLSKLSHLESLIIYKQLTDRGLKHLPRNLKLLCSLPGSKFSDHCLKLFPNLVVRSIY